MKLLTFSSLLAAPIVLVLAACGGGSDVSVDANAASAEPAGQDDAGAGAPVAKASAEALQLRASSRKPGLRPSLKPLPTTPAPNPALNPSASDNQRIAAATATAQSSTNLCSKVRPFYWEVGNRDGKQASGSIKSSSSATTVTGTVPLSIASASKWVYGMYVAQKRGGALNADDVKMLSMRSGFTKFDSCLQNQSVDACVAYLNNGVYDPKTAGAFYYNGGHMEKHASLNGLGGMTNTTLASAIMGQLGSDVKIGYSQPQLAGGAFMSADAYAKLLRKMLGGQLHMSRLLGSNPTCTNKQTCPPGEALHAPIPSSESWHYSVGHWVEDDPVVGDGAFSSAGAFGFYPWIDATRTSYGVLARAAPMGAFDSVQCGRLIRKAWFTATAL